eukprot:scaffold186036_cov31-Prasinocladus_malaysianus.AAC.1
MPIAFIMFHCVSGERPGEPEGRAAGPVDLRPRHAGHHTGPCGRPPPRQAGKGLPGPGGHGGLSPLARGGAGRQRLRGRLPQTQRTQTFASLTALIITHRTGHSSSGPRLIYRPAL